MKSRASYSSVTNIPPFLASARGCTWSTQNNGSGSDNLVDGAVLLRITPRRKQSKHPPEFSGGCALSCESPRGVSPVPVLNPLSMIWSPDSRARLLISVFAITYFSRLPCPVSIKVGRSPMSATGSYQSDSDLVWPWSYFLDFRGCWSFPLMVSSTQ